MLQLLLPALVPSWRFFDRIGPAPCVEFAITDGEDDHPAWQEVRPTPDRLPPADTIVRLFWNPRRNESLYLVSCAERLLDDPSAVRAAELVRSVADALRLDGVIGARPGMRWLRVRIVQVTREQDEQVRHVAYVSNARRVDIPGEGPA